MSPDEAHSLFDVALTSAQEQAARADDGEGVAAAALTDVGTQLTGVWVDAMVDSACLCAETGPICEAHRTGQAIRASICVRWTQHSGASVLAACGVCQERLAVFGTEVLIGIPDPSTRGVRFATLAELRPAPWWETIDADDRGVE